MWPERLVVKPTESWEVNCSTSCTQPEKGGIETTLKKTLLESERQWQRYLISNISEDTVLYCHYTCAGKQLSSKLSVVVYRECLCPGAPLSTGPGCADVHTSPGFTHHTPTSLNPGRIRSRAQAIVQDSWLPLCSDVFSNCHHNSRLPRS